MTKYPKGSDGAAEQKYITRFLAIGTAIWLVLFSMVFFGFPKTDLHTAFKATHWALHIAGCIFFFVGLLCFWAFAIHQDEMRRPGLYWSVFGIAMPFFSLGLSMAGGL